MIKCNFKQSKVNIALKHDGYYVWDTSVIKADGKYWMFTSRWKKEYGFGWQWLFQSQVVLSVSDKPEGPYTYVKNILERRGPDYFDGMNTHNPTIKEFKGKYYLYYMGDTYKHKPPLKDTDIRNEQIHAAWHAKRIGLAISDKIDGEYVRRDTPLLEPSPFPAWDSAITTNPSLVIKPDGESFMVYKSRKYSPNMDDTNHLQIGIAHAPHPAGPYTRYHDEPILNEPNTAFEDPFIWYDSKRNKYCAVMKDCIGNLTGMYGNLLYAESDDCKTFIRDENPCVIKREVEWEDGHRSLQCNLERPFILFDENGKPTHLFAASGEGKNPYCFEGETYVLCIKLEEAK